MLRITMVQLASLLMAYLPVESIIKDHQSDYYAMLEQADNAANSMVFIEFMLNLIRKRDRELDFYIGTTDPHVEMVKETGGVS